MTHARFGNRGIGIALVALILVVFAMLVGASAIAEPADYALDPLPPVFVPGDFESLAQIIAWESARSEGRADADWFVLGWRPYITTTRVTTATTGCLARLTMTGRTPDD